MTDERDVIGRKGFFVDDDDDDDDDDLKLEGAVGVLRARDERDGAVEEGIEGLLEDRSSSDLSDDDEYEETEGEMHELISDTVKESESEMEPFVYYGVRGQVICKKAEMLNSKCDLPVVWLAKIAKGMDDKLMGRVYVNYRNGHVFCCCNKTMYCLDNKTGRIQWEHTIMREAGVLSVDETSFVVDDMTGNVVASSFGNVMCLDQANGLEHWIYKIPVADQQFEHATLLLCGRLLVVTAERLIACINVDDGKEIWLRKFTERLQVMSSVAWNGGSVLMVCGSGFMRRFDITSGDQIGAAFPLGGYTPAAVMFDSLRRRFIVASGGKVWCFDDDDANTKEWMFTIPNASWQRCSSLALEESSGNVFIPAKSSVFCLEPNGEVLWEAILPSRFMALATVLFDETSSGALLVCGIGSVFILDPGTGEILKKDNLSMAPFACVTACTNYHFMESSATCFNINPVAHTCVKELAGNFSSLLPSLSILPFSAPPEESTTSPQGTVSSPQGMSS